MDFETQMWDVGAEADHLAASLFNQTFQGKNKQMKRKMKEKNNCQKLKKMKGEGQKSNLSNGSGGLGNQAKLNNKDSQGKDKKTENHAKDMNKTVIDGVKDDTSLDKQASKKGKKKKDSNSIVGKSVTVEELKEKGKLKNRDSTSEAVNPSKGKANSVQNESEGAVSNAVKGKKKRKRKCKKNKFKDYSKDEEDQTTARPEIDVKESVKAETVTNVQNSKKEKKNKKKKKTNVSTDRKDSPKKPPGFNVDILNSMLLNNSSGKKPESDAPESVDRTLHEKSAVKPKPKSLLEKNRERLNAARFRYLNEQMYTSTGKDAFKMYAADGEAFKVYHEGFQSQVEKWPVNPLDDIIKEILAKPKHMVVADFGCGDAKLALGVPNKVHSFDLVALNDRVTACDMSKVPLKDCSVDIAVFCLSLMGTNLTDYLQEASRVLRPGGLLKVAEVLSRFTNVGSFILQVEKLGFKIIRQDSENKMFVRMDFRKVTPKSQTKTAVEDIQLKPCVYKKR